MPRQGIGPILHSSQESTHPQRAAQTRGICPVLGGNRPLLLQGYGPRHGSTGEEPTLVPGGVISYLTILESTALPLFIVPTSLSLFYFFHFSTT